MMEQKQITDLFRYEFESEHKYFIHGFDEETGERKLYGIAKDEEELEKCVQRFKNWGLLVKVYERKELIVV